MPDSEPISMHELFELVNVKANAVERSVIDELFRLYTAATCIQKIFEKAPTAAQWLQQVIDLDLAQIVDSGKSTFSKINTHIQNADNGIASAKEFTYDGKTYKVVTLPSEKIGICEDCAFKHFPPPCTVLQAENLIPPCISSSRPDGKRAYFKEKETE